MAKFDPKLFNTDPKYQEQRDFLDAINEESMKRVIAKRKKENPEEPENIFDIIFGGKKED